MSGIRWEESQLAAYTKKVAAAKTPEEEKILRAHKATQRFQALGRIPKGQMNKTEAAYVAEVLDPQLRRGEILGWQFHPMNIRLADHTFYEADFQVLHADMTMAIHETKGEFTTEKGQMKIKLAAEAQPWYRFYKCIKLSKKNGGGWKIEEFSA